MADTWSKRWRPTSTQSAFIK